MEKITWFRCVKKDVGRGRNERPTCHATNECMLTGMVTSCVRTVFENALLIKDRRDEKAKKKM